MSAVKLTAGASRKLNLQAYGGRPYESEDLWVSIELERPDLDGKSQQERLNATAELQLEARKVVDALASDRVRKLSGGKAQ